MGLVEFPRPLNTENEVHVLKHMIRKITIQFMHKYVDENRMHIQRINLKTKDISYFNLSSNSIMMFMHEGNQCYFRECSKIFDTQKFFKSAIDRFFDTLGSLSVNTEHFAQEIPINIYFSNDCVSLFRDYLDKIFSDKRFFRKIKNSDLISDEIKFSIWNNKQIYDKQFFEAFGLIDVPNSLYEIALYFLWYMRSVATNYRNLRVVHGNQHSFFSGVKSISSRIVAEELRLEHLIADVRWCLLEIDGKEEVLGLLSEAAPGHRMYDAKMSANGSLQRELMNLNVLDVICFQRDHGPNNYNILMNEDSICSVCAFDNDHPYTFFPIPSIHISMSACTPLIDKNDIILRPYFDKNTEEAIQQLDFKRLKKRLKPYLNFLQIHALVCRIKKLRKALTKTKSIKEEFLLNDSDWNEKTVLDEMYGAYGTTYLVKAVQVK